MMGHYNNILCVITSISEQQALNANLKARLAGESTEEQRFENLTAASRELDNKLETQQALKRSLVAKLSLVSDKQQLKSLTKRSEQLDVELDRERSRNSTLKGQLEAAPADRESSKANTATSTDS